MTSDLLLCLLSQSTNRRQKGEENAEDSELKYIF